MIRSLVSAMLLLSLLIPLTALAGDQEKDFEIAVTKGTYAIETGEYVTAIESLKKALAIKPKDKAATRAIGIAYSRSGDSQNAKTALLDAVALDPADWRSRYELGVACSNLGEYDLARNYFNETAEGAPDDSLKAAARSHLDFLDTKEPQKKKPYTLDVLAGLQYDTNVMLQADNPTVNQGQKADWRAVLSLGGTYDAVRTDRLTVRAGYLFYQSLHRDLTDFNINQNNVSLAGEYQASQLLQAALRYKLSYSLAGGDLYSTVNQVTPVVLFRISPDAIAEVYYTYQFHKFFDSGTFPANDYRSGDNQSAGITGTVRLGRSSVLSLGYAYDADSTKKDYWDYKGHKGLLSLKASLSGVTLIADASYYDQRYSAPFPGYAATRHDGTQEYSVTLIKELNRHFVVSFAELYVIDRSNLSDFEYTRSITSLLAVLKL